MEYSSSDSDAEDEIIVQAYTSVMEDLKAEAEAERIIRRRNQVNRDRAATFEGLIRDYFAPDQVYNHKQFKDRFRMGRPLFLRIVADIEQHFEYFQQKSDARGYMGFCALHKCTSAIRHLAYGSGHDSWDEYLKISEKCARDTLYEFCDGVIELYAKKYLRKPNSHDIQQLYEHHEAVHGFPGMLGSIDCMHWEWSNCPNAWRGQHLRGDHPHPTIMLEAVASQDRWIWHAFFGVAGSNNDINVLDQSPVFEDIVSGVAPGSSFYANGNEYLYGYYLADGIYPEWATLMKAFSYPNDVKRKYFKKRQESARKDIERTFATLKKKWAIIRNPARMWTKERIRKVMYACIILHNMILEDKGYAICEYIEEDEEESQPAGPEVRYANRRAIESRETFNNLRADLVDHLWANRRNEDD